MSGYSGVTGNLAKIGLLLLLLSILGCNTLKKVGEDELLLTKNTILVDEEKVTSSEIKGLISQNPTAVYLDIL